MQVRSFDDRKERKEVVVNLDGLATSFILAFT